MTVQPSSPGDGTGNAFKNLQTSLASGGAGSGSANFGVGIPVVRLGEAYNPPRRAADREELKQGIAPAGKPPQIKFGEPQTVDAAKSAIYGWDDQQVKDWAKQAWYYGYLDSPDDIQGAFKAWQYAVEQASLFQSRGSMLTPEDALGVMAGSQENLDRLAKRDRAGGTVTQKSQSVDLSDPTQVTLLIEQAFKAKMGRGPTDAETRTLINSLHAAQRANPTSTTTTTRYGPDGNVLNQSSLNSGGVAPEGFVSGQVDVDPEAAEYQAAGPMFNALLRALGPASGTLGR